MPARNNRRSEFYALLSEAIADLQEHGFDSQSRLDGWLRRLEVAARRALVPQEVLQAALRDSLTRIYERTVTRGKLAQMHAEVGEYTLARVKPKLRAELDRRILASANLIVLNREASIQRTLQRFAGWATSIPIGGTEAESRAEIAKGVRRGISGLPFEERRVIIDQGHKLVASINDIVATDGGAIAAIWRHVNEGGGYQARPEHEARDGVIFVVRDNWALKEGLIKLDGHQYTDEVEGPAQLPYCRCVPGSTRIPFANIKTVYRRRYDGILIEITTASGKSLRLTPNHPVLSFRGWISADALNVGNHLVESVEKIVEASRKKDKNEAVATISQIFDFLAPRGSQSCAEGAGHQFHGDGIVDRDVDVVRANGTLRIDGDSCLHQGVNYLGFSNADSARSATCSLSKHRGCFWSAFVRTTEKCASLFLGGLRLIRESILSSLHMAAEWYSRFFQAIANSSSVYAVLGGEHFGRRARVISGNNLLHWQIDALSEIRGGLGLVSNLYPTFSQATPNRSVRHLELLCEIHGIDPSKVLFGEIVDVKRISFSGHVYNLETEDGWYSAEGIITHNCSYEYLYSLRDLPPEMLTAKGREALEQARQRLTGS